MEKKMALINKKLMETGTDGGAQGPWDLPAASWTTSERYSKNKHFRNSSTNHWGGWGHRLRGGKGEVRIMIMFKTMGVLVNASDQPIQHKLDILGNTIINEGIAIVGLEEINSNWSKIPIQENIYNRTDEWLKTIRIST